MKIEPIRIVYTATGRQMYKAYNWLLSVESDWTMDVNPFIIQDQDLKRKVEGLTFNEKPVADLLISKYPKHGLELYLRTSTEEKEEILETKEVKLEDLVTKGISEIKMVVDEIDIDIDALIELEEQNKNRKTLIDYLHGIK